jgi:hypothetical protein
MLDFHRSNRADLTLAVRPFEVRFHAASSTPTVRRGRKARHRNFINAASICSTAACAGWCRRASRMTWPSLIGRAIAEGRVISFPLRDAGSTSDRQDYARAVSDVKEGKV